MGSNPIRATEFIRELARFHRPAAPRKSWAAIWAAISRGRLARACADTTRAGWRVRSGDFVNRRSAVRVCPSAPILFGKSRKPRSGLRSRNDKTRTEINVGLGPGDVYALLLGLGLAPTFRYLKEATSIVRGTKAMEVYLIRTAGTTWSRGIS